MKEERFFYAPELAEQEVSPSRGDLEGSEANHALRVLRLGVGDEIRLMDGKGTFYRATITTATGHRLLYQIDEAEPQQPAWQGHLHLAMAPTKLMDRVEWFAEKATEIGFDELSFLNCKFSERKVMRTVRLEKIVVSAMKQSRKPWKPVVNQMQSFREFISQPREGLKFIAHCYQDIPREDFFGIVSRAENAQADGDITVLIGPEGDFSPEEVRAAIDHGYQSISLGSERLRTETAALSAVMMAHLVRRL